MNYRDQVALSLHFPTNAIETDNISALSATSSHSTSKSHVVKSNMRENLELLGFPSLETSAKFSSVIQNNKSMNKIQQINPLSSRNSVMPHYERRSEKKLRDSSPRRDRRNKENITDISRRTSTENKENTRSNRRSSSRSRTNDSDKVRSRSKKIDVRRERSQRCRDKCNEKNLRIDDRSERINGYNLETRPNCDNRISRDETQFYERVHEPQSNYVQNKTKRSITSRSRSRRKARGIDQQRDISVIKGAEIMKSYLASGTSSSSVTTSSHNTESIAALSKLTDETLSTTLRHKRVVDPLEDLNEFEHTLRSHQSCVSNDSVHESIQSIRERRRRKQIEEIILQDNMNKKLEEYLAMKQEKSIELQRREIEIEREKLRLQQEKLRLQRVENRSIENESLRNGRESYSLNQSNDNDKIGDNSNWENSINSVSEKSPTPKKKLFLSRLSNQMRPSMKESSNNERPNNMLNSVRKKLRSLTPLRGRRRSQSPFRAFRRDEGKSSLSATPQSATTTLSMQGRNQSQCSTDDNKWRRSRSPPKVIKSSIQNSWCMNNDDESGLRTFNPNTENESFSHNRFLSPLHHSQTNRTGCHDSNLKADSNLAIGGNQCSSHRRTMSVPTLPVSHDTRETQHELGFDESNMKLLQNINMFDSLENDPAYLHARNAGILWQTLVG